MFIYDLKLLISTEGFPTLFLDVQSLRNLRKTEKYSEILRNLRNLRNFEKLEKFEKSEKFREKFPEINFFNYLK
jgi:neutral trehalase